MSHSRFRENPWQPPLPFPRAGPKLTVKFFIQERNGGQPKVIIRPVRLYPNQIRDRYTHHGRWFMPWEERLRATVPISTERVALTHAIFAFSLWCHQYEQEQVTDDQIILTGMRDVLALWEARAEAALRSGDRMKQRLWCPGPVMEGQCELFVGLFKVVDMDVAEWNEVKEYSHGWGRVFDELVRGRRELKVGETRVKFWSSTL
ncbi:hypothetical protein B0T20DRAFT_350325 [Sordaria brevicollis]|uniref:Uncharacterized protein n=1 Tax=Sordaria brevicollis TaxID=83679 RepID=A0AAE0UD83_SORBR|nr:hypothetical protein B0T20DRAFT_350325 [Sordaria brevicollis]